MARRTSNPNFMNGVPELLVLHVLAQHEMYGYELIRAIAEQTGKRITFGEGVIYPTLHEFERNGCLKSRRKEVAGRSRVYYCLTARGRKRLAATTGDWERITQAIETLIGRRGDVESAT